MGVFQYALAGAAQGVGNAMATYGSNMAREQERRLAEEERRRREDAIYNRQVDLEMLRQQGRTDLAVDRGAGSGSGGRGGTTPADKLRALSDTTGLSIGALASMAGEMPRQQVDDAMALANGQTPTNDVSLPADRFTNPDRRDDAEASGVTSAKVPKYTDGQGVALMKQAWDGLAKAIGVASTSSADDAAKAAEMNQRTENERRFVDSGGKDRAAGAGALLAQGHGSYSGDGTDVLTGQAAKGSVAESKIVENRAQANNANASAGQHAAAAKKLASEAGGALEDGASKERLNNLLNSLNNTAKDINVQMDPDTLAQVNSARKAILARINDIAKGGGGALPSAAKPLAGPAAAPSRASQFKVLR